MSTVNIFSVIRDTQWSRSAIGGKIVRFLPSINYIFYLGFNTNIVISLSFLFSNSCFSISAKFIRGINVLLNWEGGFRLKIHFDVPLDTDWYIV